MPRLLALAVLVLVAHLGATARVEVQAYPTRTVRFIIPFGAASTSDINARLFADRLAARWGKPVVGENRPGGDGLVAAVRSPPHLHRVPWGSQSSGL